MNIPIYKVDAFTDTPFKGNPAGVCILPTPADETWMRNVAREMNLSETAFIIPTQEGYPLRWFTPVTEINLCGHATLASAHILWEREYLPEGETARFHTRSGVLTAEKTGEGITLNFPAKQQAQVDPPAGLLEALGISARYTGRTGSDYIIEVDSEAVVREMKPDFGKLVTLPVRGVMVTSRSDAPEYDFVSRFFVPAVGVNEDPVTGSAHCCLGPYWSARLGKSELRAYQASSRGGEIRIQVSNDRVFLSGQARTVLVGVLVVPYGC